MQQSNLQQSAVKSALDTICPKNHGRLRLSSDVVLSKGRIHEVQGDSADIFAMIAASRLSGKVFWIGLSDDIETLAPTGMQHFFDPARLQLVKGVSRLEVLCASEEALRTTGIACVVIELQSGPDLRESRRLQLACEESGVLGLILIKGRAQTSASETRWRCDATPDAQSLWRWNCIKHRKGETGSWDVNWRGYGNAGVIHIAATASA